MRAVNSAILALCPEGTDGAVVGPREPVPAELDVEVCLVVDVSLVGDVCLGTVALPGAAAAVPDAIEGPLTATTDLELEGAVVAVAI